MKKLFTIALMLFAMVDFFAAQDFCPAVEKVLTKNTNLSGFRYFLEFEGDLTNSEKSALIAYIKSKNEISLIDMTTVSCPKFSSCEDRNQYLQSKYGTIDKLIIKNFTKPSENAVSFNLVFDHGGLWGWERHYNVEVSSQKILNEHLTIEWYY